MYGHRLYQSIVLLHTVYNVQRHVLASRDVLAQSGQCTVSEYIDYTEPGENHNSRFWIGFGISLFSSAGPYYHV